MEKEIIPSSKPVTVKGYAISGGGRAIYRVELSADGGKTWEPVDKIEQTPDKTSGMYWAWALWEKKLPKIMTTSELVARACKFDLYSMAGLICGCESTWASNWFISLYFVFIDDSSGNIQPEFPIWNYRGVMNNAWFRVSNVTQMPQSNMWIHILCEIRAKSFRIKIKEKRRGGKFLRLSSCNFNAPEFGTSWPFPTQWSANMLSKFEFRCTKGMKSSWTVVKMMGVVLLMQFFFGGVLSIVWELGLCSWFFIHFFVYQCD